ncbi:16995_t:CDS:2 [Rhizophagus irregularis]|nr:16995_t:CDS:2 [Rhizophagus irregularis]
MSNNIKDNKVSLSLSDNDNIKISEALSFIRNKLQGRLKNISVINDRTAVVIYGKHKDRLMIDLKDNNYYENLEEKLEALKAENNNLLSELKKFETLARFDGSFSTVVSSDNYNNETSLVDNISTTSTASNNLPSMSSPSISTSSKPFKLEDYITVLNNDLNTVNQSIEDDSDEIWEKLNSRCHKKFGYNNEIKQPTREDIKWGADILPIYAEWKKLKDFKYNKNEVDEDVEIMEIDVENDDIQNEETEDKAKKNLEAKELKEKKFKKFGEKLRKLVMDDLQSNTHDSPVQKLADKDMVNESDLQNNNLTHSLNLLTAEPIKIIDKTSGIQRVKQWALQKNQIEKIGIAFNVFKFYHRMSLIDIYNEINVVAESNFPNQKGKQRTFVKEIICIQEGISERSERRFKTSAMRLQHIVSAGISFNQIIKVGMHVSDFESTNHFYEIFMEALDINSIENLNEGVRPLNTKILFDKLSAYEIMELD